MSLMRALKGVATGYLGARVDMMAQEAAKKREKDAREQREAEERKKRAEARETAVEGAVKQQRRGSGATSLLTGGRGGMGYFDETL
jgi:hypothetical protein